MNERLKELRKNKKLSIREMAKLLNLTKDTYNNYERGISKMPCDVLYNICKLFNTSADYLLGLVDFI